jgi:hypothetical protein
VGSVARREFIMRPLASEQRPGSTDADTIERSAGENGQRTGACKLGILSRQQSA